MAAQFKWSIGTLDVSAAYLQGDPIERDVYVTPPDEFRTPGHIWKLNCAIYGVQ